jgi:hypothetical protein
VVKAGGDQIRSDVRIGILGQGPSRETLHDERTRSSSAQDCLIQVLRSNDNTGSAIGACPGLLEYGYSELLFPQAHGNPVFIVRILVLHC